MTFCNDADMLYWEPDVMRDATFASQTLATGAGDLAGTVFTKTTGPSFLAQHVEPGHVLVLSGTAVGCFVITDVPNGTQLAISILHNDPFPGDTGVPFDPVAPQPDATGATYAIRTFWAQRKVVSDLLMQAVGIVPGTAAAEATAILNPEALRRACVLGTLQMVYSAIAAAATDPARFSLRADLYERLYRRALQRAQVDLDTNGDGRADVRRSPGLVRMVRE
jgi:hypothetical protein